MRRLRTPRWCPSPTRAAPFLIVLMMVGLLGPLAYCVRRYFHHPGDSWLPLPASAKLGGSGEDCCRGKDHVELWGAVVKWGSDHKLGSASDCCRACKAMCTGDGQCLCNSWVFCGDRERCGDKLGECWLKKQRDPLFPSVNQFGEHVMWTSGFIYEKGQGSIGLETVHGTIRISLFPDCSPYSVAYILDILATRHCYGCQINRAEGRGDSWDPLGQHIPGTSFGPPHALIQGKLEDEGIPFDNLPAEASPMVQRGSVGWIDNGPQFFISLANHNEWRQKYTIFGNVLPEDMYIAEKIAGLKSKSKFWGKINVSVLEEPIRVKIMPIRPSPNKP